MDNQIEYLLTGKDKDFKRALLGRLLSDCNSFFGEGGRSPYVLWAKDIKEQIEVIKELQKQLNEFDFEVFGITDIDKLETLMMSRYSEKREFLKKFKNK